MQREYINREIEPVLSEALNSGKVLVVYGSRQTGKTTVVERLLADAQIRAGGIVRLSGDVLQRNGVVFRVAITSSSSREEYETTISQSFA